MVNHNNKTNNRAFPISIALWIITSLWPVLGNVVSYVMGWAVIIIGLYYYPILLRKRAFVYLFLFLLICLIYSLIGKGYPFINVAIFFPTFFACVVASYGISRMPQKQIYCLFYILLGLLLFSVVSTFFILQENPNAVRNVGYGENTEIGVTKAMSLAYARRGMYSYGTGEALAVITPAFLVFALNTKRVIWSILIFLTVGMAIITQIIGTLATSSIITLVSSSAVLLASAFLSNHKQKLRYGIVIISFILFGLYYLVPIIVENSSMMTKIIDIEDSYTTGESTGLVGGRTDLMLQSIYVFLRNPVFGFGDIPRFFGDTHNGNTVSMHSAFFDYLGLYGMFAFLFFLSWKKATEFTYRMISAKQRKKYVWCLLSAVFLCVLKGPVTLTTTFQFSTVFTGIVFMMVYYSSNLEIIGNEKNSNMG